jgi:hypothetical protein
LSFSGKAPGLQKARGCEMKKEGEKEGEEEKGGGED